MDKPATPARGGDELREDFLSQLRRVNTDRYHAWVGDGEDAGILFDAAELGGEVGELLNVVKKLEREARGWRGSRAAPEDFGDECADVLICLDKLARRHDVDLAAATIAKFNATSDKVGLPHKLLASTDMAGAGEWALIQRLRDEEADSVTILCDNSDGPPNNAVECCGFWTGFAERRFEGDTIVAALRLAVAAKDEALRVGYPEPAAPPVEGLTSGEGEVEKLKEALKPFAEIAHGEVYERFKADAFSTFRISNNDGSRHLTFINAECFDAARAALHPVDSRAQGGEK